jgi:Ala-tRNA(Pro) deacylase
MAAPVTEPLTSEADLLAYLRAEGIPFEYTAHPPVYTCAEADQYRPALPGVHTKNLFLRDRRGRFYLLMTDCARSVDLKALSQALPASKLHFGSPAELQARLGVLPGAVTVLALVNDPAGAVELLIDSAVWPQPAYLCHPLVNTATLTLARADLERFFRLTGHVPRVLDVPLRAG